MLSLVQNRFASNGCLLHDALFCDGAIMLRISLLIMLWFVCCRDLVKLDYLVDFKTTIFVKISLPCYGFVKSFVTVHVMRQALTYTLLG